MRRRILLADDSVTIQKVIELTFLDEDYEVKAVSNGDEAIAALPQVNPDFVIADVHMPGANGYEVCRRSKETLPEVPVLLLVGTFEPFDEAQARSVGADSFLKKPFDSQELLQRVEELLASRSPAAPAAPAPSAAVAAPPPDWSFQLESAPLPPPADPFLAPAREEDQPFPAFGESSFETPGFVLDEEPAGGALRVDESAVLPAGEPLFELDATSDLTLGDEIPPYEAPSFDQTPAFEPSSFESPSFESPSFETPSFAPTSYEPPPLEPSVFEPLPFEPPPLPTETRRIDTGVLQDYGFATTPEERLGVPQESVPLVESLAETETRIEAPPPPSIEASHEPASAVSAAPAGGWAVGSAVPAGASTGNGGGALSDADVERIARRVVELIADRAIRDVAWEVIPDMAEMVIRDRLRELESQAESFE